MLKFHYLKGLNPLKLGVSLLLISLTGFSSGQQTEASMKHLLELTEASRFSNPDSALIYSGQLKKLALKKNNLVYYAKALLNEARELIILGDLKQSSINLKQCIKLFEKQHQSKDLANSYNLMHIIFLRLNNEKKGLEYLKKAHELFLKTGDREGIWKTSSNLSNFYISSNRLENVDELLKTEEKYLDRTSEEIYYFESNYAKYYQAKQQYVLSNQRAEQAVRYAQQFNMQDAEVSARSLIARNYFLLKDYQKSEEKNLEALALAKKHRLLQEQKLILSDLIELAENQGDYKKSFLLSKEHNLLKDSIFNLDKLSYIHELDMRLNLKDKEQVIAQQRNNLLKNKLKQEENKRNTYVLISILLVIVLGLFLLMNSYQRIKRKNKIIEEQRLEVEQQKNELSELNILNKKIFSIISHDFKSPINSLEMLTEMLSEKKIDKEEFSDFLPDIQNQLQQSKSVLDNLIHFAQSELNIHLHVEKSCLVREVSEELLLLQKQALQHKNLRVECQVPAKLAVPVSKELLKIVLGNLLTNAIKFSYEGGTIRVFALEDGIAVSDEGVGMAQSDFDLLFTGQVKHRPGTQFEMGYGLGLKISSDLLQKAGGKIGVRKNEPRGVIFTLTFNQEK